MEEAINGVILVFYKFVDFLFYGANIRTGLSLGFVLMAASITGTIIGTLSPRVVGQKADTVLTKRGEKDD